MAVQPLTIVEIAELYTFKWCILGYVNYLSIKKIKAGTLPSDLDLNAGWLFHLFTILSPPHPKMILIGPASQGCCGDVMPLAQYLAVKCDRRYMLASISVITTNGTRRPMMGKRQAPPQQAFRAPFPLRCPPDLGLCYWNQMNMIQHPLPYTERDLSLDFYLQRAGLQISHFSFPCCRGTPLLVRKTT